MNNPVLEGLQQFNQSIGQLAQSRALQQASQTVQQIQQSELADAEKQQALQQFGQQFALQAMSIGMDPSQALAVGQQIGPKRPLIQSGLQAALYGTPQEQAAFNAYDQREQQQALDLKTADDARLLAMQDKQLAMQKYGIDQNSLAKQQQLMEKRKKTAEAEVSKLNERLAKGQDFQELQLINGQLGTAEDLYAAAGSDPVKLAQADKSLAYILAKSRDPKTGVRDSELKLAGASGLIDNADKWLEKINSGQQLLPQERKAIIDNLRIFQNAYGKVYEQRTAPIKKKITELGGEVMNPFGQMTPSAAANPPQQQGAMPGGFGSLLVPGGLKIGR